MFERSGSTILSTIGRKFNLKKTFSCRLSRKAILYISSRYDRKGRNINEKSCERGFKIITFVSFHCVLCVKSVKKKVASVCLVLSLAHNNLFYGNQISSRCYIITLLYHHATGSRRHRRGCRGQWSDVIK